MSTAQEFTGEVGRRRLQAFHVVGHITCYVVDASRAASSGAVMEGGTQSTRLGSMELCPLPIGMDNDLRHSRRDVRKGPEPS